MNLKFGTVNITGLFTKDLRKSSKLDTYVRTVLLTKKFDTVHQEYKIQKTTVSGKIERIHGDSKSIVNGAFCMGLQLGRVSGGEGKYHAIISLHQSDDSVKETLLGSIVFQTFETEAELDKSTLDGHTFVMAIHHLMKEMGISRAQKIDQKELRADAPTKD